MPDKLHLGCFDRIFDGWINTDITPHIFIAKIPFLPVLLFRVGLMSKDRLSQHLKGTFNDIRYVDVTKKFPWPDNLFTNVYSSHMLEHLYRDDALYCISEIFRVLQPGGILRIAVPDLDEMIDSYNPKDPEEFLEVFFEARHRDAAKNQHHWHYNECLLKNILISAGFREVTRCIYKKGKIADIEIIDQRPNSLFMEAIK